MPKKKVVIGRGRGRPPKRRRLNVNFNCEICMDSKPIGSKFKAQKPKCCSQSFCMDCITKYVDAKVQDGISTVECPNVDCKVVIDPQVCIGFMPKQVFDRWENALSSSMIMAYTNQQCPFEDCSTGLVVEDEDEKGKKKKKEGKGDECPHCKRLFCVNCKVAWHDGLECKDFKELREDEKSEDDILLCKLAKQRQWMRCPSCRVFVERTVGCNHMTCRCGRSFCYRCGTAGHDRCC